VTSSQVPEDSQVAPVQVPQEEQRGGDRPDWERVVPYEELPEITFMQPEGPGQPESESQ